VTVTYGGAQGKKPEVTTKKGHKETATHCERIPVVRNKGGMSRGEERDSKGKRGKRRRVGKKRKRVRAIAQEE